MMDKDRDSLQHDGEGWEEYEVSEWDPLDDEAGHAAADEAMCSAYDEPVVTSGKGTVLEDIAGIAMEVLGEVLEAVIDAVT